MLGQNHFAEPIWHALTFPHPILICRVTYWVPVEFCLDSVVLFAELVIFHCTSLWFLQSPVSWHQQRQRNMPPQQGDSRKHCGQMEKCSERAAADGDRHTPVFELVNWVRSPVELEKLSCNWLEVNSTVGVVCCVSTVDLMEISATHHFVHQKLLFSAYILMFKDDQRTLF